MSEHDVPTDAATTGGLPVSPSMGPALDAAARAAHHPRGRSRGLLHQRAFDRRRVRRGPHRRALAVAHRIRHEHRVLQRFSTAARVAGRPSPRLARGLRAGARRHHRRAHGALRLEGDSRPRHSRGDGAGADQREPHPAAHHVPQAAVGGDRDRHRRTVRRRRPDHRHRRRARLAVGQVLRTTAAERKTLLAAGAAAGMAATFGSPVSAVLLAVELLLFEFRPRSIIPVALASATAQRCAWRFVGAAPVFAMPELAAAQRRCALAAYIVLGALVGVARRRRHARRLRRRGRVREAAHSLDVVAGARRRSPSASSATSRRARMGVGYDNIEQHPWRRARAARRCCVLCVLKFVSWSISLGSGTSGGTLAPLFTIGGGARRAARRAGRALASRARHRSAHRRAGRHGRDVRRRVARAARLGRLRLRDHAAADRPAAAARRLHRGVTSSRACCMRNTIMTEKIARRGARDPASMPPTTSPGSGSRSRVESNRDCALAPTRRWTRRGLARAQCRTRPSIRDFRSSTRTARWSACSPGGTCWIRTSAASAHVQTLVHARTAGGVRHQLACARPPI